MYLGRCIYWDKVYFNAAQLIQKVTRAFLYNHVFYKRKVSQELYKEKLRLNDEEAKAWICRMKSRQDMKNWLFSTKLGKRYWKRRLKVEKKFRNITENKLLKTKKGQKLRVEYRPRKGRENAMGFYDPDLHMIVINLDTLLDGNRKTTSARADRLMRHELFYAMTRVALEKRYGTQGWSSKMEAMSKRLTPKQKKVLDEAYGGAGYQFKSPRHVYRGYELTRAVMEEFFYGITTEQENNTKGDTQNIKDDPDGIFRDGQVYRTAKLFIKDVQSYIANIFGKEVLADPILAQVLLDSG